EMGCIMVALTIKTLAQDCLTIFNKFQIEKNSEKPKSKLWKLVFKEKKSAQSALNSTKTLFDNQPPLSPTATKKKDFNEANEKLQSLETNYQTLSVQYKELEKEEI